MADQATQERSGGAGPEATRAGRTTTPAADIYETRDNLVLLLEMPGVAPDAIDVVLDKHVLTVRGSGSAAAPEGCTLVHAEYRAGDYERSFTVSEAIDTDKIEASMKNGVLRLTLPKASPPPAKTFAVQAGVGA